MILYNERTDGISAKENTAKYVRNTAWLRKEPIITRGICGLNYHDAVGIDNYLNPPSAQEEPRYF